MSRAPDNVFSLKRFALCSRENAVRVAAHLCAQTGACIYVVRTGDPLQPYRVAPVRAAGQTVDLEMRM